MAKKKSSGGAPKKRGHHSEIVGRRTEHLGAELDRYCTASATGTTRAWYPQFFKRYWDLFPWNIPFNEDPTDEAVAATPDEKTLTTEQKAEKKKIVEETEAKIKRWLNYQRAHSGSGVNPWSRWLAAELRAPEDERRPRRLLDYQVYMQDEEKNKAINAALAERFPDKVGATDSIKWRAALARELLAAESEEVQDEYRRRGEEEFEEAMEEFTKTESKGAKAEEFDEDARAEARARLVATVKPLLLSIRKLTGYHVTMLVGGVINGKVQVRSVHGGTLDGKNEEGPDGVDFTRWDPEGYKPVMRQFMRYIAAASGIVQNAPEGAAGESASGPSTSAAAAGAIPPAAPLAPPPPSSHPPAMPPAPAPPLFQPAATPPLLRADSATPPPCSELLKDPAAGSAPAASIAADAPAPAAEEEDGEIDVDGWGRRQLLELTPGTRRLRVAQLEHMSVYDRTREENMARNKEILASCSITDEVAALMRDVRRDMKRKGEGEGGSATKRARTGGADGGAEYEDDDGSGSDDDVEREGTPIPRVQPKRKGGGARTAKGGQTAVGDGNVPKWASDAHAALLAGGGGDLWVRIVNLWWDYETKAKYVGPARGKGTGKRPKEVSAWIGRARSGGPVPAIIDVSSFASRWWTWWEEINPAWRGRTGTVAKRLVKEGDGDWASVASSGPNGMLNIVICLKWWHDALRGDAGGMAGWNEAVEDVAWALERICGSQGGGEEGTEV
ncbi:hypothetical protein C8F04DRAFT_1199093 [Mycena alexandri]|uniref:Uncharacterized protein n=1 Tax=Mycena alexandri TaxID=1745969 RepID=A0AAD6S1S1_9AGAR|nr:hypothetical protein C8F04DRAFT_1199093 [Mycena alexandri]